MSPLTQRNADDRTSRPEPVSVVDGSPDRSPKPAAWKYVLLAGGVLVWLAFLVYCAVAGNVE